MAVAKYSLLICVWACFPIGSHAMPAQRHSQPTLTSLHWVKDICVLRCHLPPALLAEWQGSFMCHCSNTEMEETQNKSQHTKLTLEKRILLPLLPIFKLTTFQSRVKRSTNMLPRLPGKSRRWIFFSRVNQLPMLTFISVSIPTPPHPRLLQ